MAICSRCGAEFVYLDELKNQKLDIYVKVESQDINGKKMHKWKHLYICPKCDEKIYGEIVKKA